MAERLLEGRRVLVVEDEYFIASDLISHLEDAGARVYGPVSEVEQAVAIAKSEDFKFDWALLDVNLDGQMIFPVASLLQERHIPFVFVTGYECAAIPNEFKKAPCFNKPYEERRLISLLASRS